MCCRYYMEMSPELRPIVEEMNRSPLAGRMRDRLARPLTAEGEVRPTDIVPVIATGNERILKGVKGIGLRTAQRIIVDLKDKLPEGEWTVGGTSAPNTQQPAFNTQVRDEAVGALTMLGFAPAPSSKVVVGILKEQPDLPVEQVVKLALKQIK